VCGCGCGCVGVWLCAFDCVRPCANSARDGRVVQVLAAAALLWLGEVASFETLDADVVRFLAQRGLSPPAMDLDQVERTKRHYDAHAKPPAGSRKDALRQREQVCAVRARACAPPRARAHVPRTMSETPRTSASPKTQGPAFQLKRFHNDVKRELINCYSRGARRLLDLGCGRGGMRQCCAADNSRCNTRARTLARTRAHAFDIAHVACADSIVLQVTCRSGWTPKCGRWWALIYRQRRLTRQSAATASFGFPSIPHPPSPLQPLCARVSSVRGRASSQTRAHTRTRMCHRRRGYTHTRTHTLGAANQCGLAAVGRAGAGLAHSLWPATDG